MRLTLARSQAMLARQRSKEPSLRVVILSVMTGVLLVVYLAVWALSTFAPSLIRASMAPLAAAGPHVDGATGVSVAVGSRALLQEASYNPVASCDYNHAFFPANAAGFVGLLLIGCYMFLAAAIACDEYFIASLTKLSAFLGMSEAVAGATLLAGGTSLPELFVSLISTLQYPNSPAGFGTIWGSVIYNHMIIIGLSALLAREVLVLDWRPFLREMVFYVISVITLLLILLTGNHAADWYEGLIMLAVYGGYVLFIKFSPQILTCSNPNQDLQDAIAVIRDRRVQGEVPAETPIDVARIERELKEKAAAAAAAVELAPAPPADAVAKALEQIRHELAQAHPDDVALAVAAAPDGRATPPEPEREPEPEPAAAAADREPAAMPAAAREPDSGEVGSPGSGGATGAAESPAAHASPSAAEASPPAAPAHGSAPHAAATKRPAGAAAGGDRARGSIDAMIRQELRLTADPPRALSFDIERMDPAVRAAMQGIDPSLAMRPYLPEDTRVAGRGGSGPPAPPEHGARPRQRRHHPATGAVADQRSAARVAGQARHRAPRRAAPAVAAATAGTEDEHSLLSWPRTPLKRFVKAVSFPVLLLMYITVPDCRKPRWERWYPLTFAMALVWIAGITYLMFISAFMAGCWAGIPDSVMGLTWLAAGTSLPDTISSVIVGRLGYGDMAVANALGSNTFDILIAFGVPWLIGGLAFRRPLAIDSRGFYVYLGAGAGLIVMMPLVLIVNRFRIYRGVGAVLLAGYAAFLVLVFLTGFPWYDPVIATTSLQG